jgi:hypothetical protein
MDLLYHHFLGLRLSSLWTSELVDMVEWLAHSRKPSRV